MYKWIGLLLIGLVSVAAVVYFLRGEDVINPIGDRVQEITEKPLEKYGFERLIKADIDSSQITIGKLLKDDEDFVSYEFSYCVDQNYVRKNSESECTHGGRVTGLINIPREAGTYPVLVMYRGFVARENFTTGEGTRRTAEEFARNGFITLAPDFLGYGGSDPGSDGSIEDRLQTYPTAVTLLNSVEYLNQALESFETNQATITPSVSSGQARQDIEVFKPVTGVRANTEKVGIWGHSNGGHISLSTLAITGRAIPTVLWNPVTKPFPYSILYFTDEFEDEGKALRKVVADFEAEYDVFDYSPTKFYDRISAPIQLHQAVEDEAVPVRWSDQFADSMEELDKAIEYFKYPGENHNFNLGSWDIAMERSIDFYTQQFEAKEE